MIAPTQADQWRVLEQEPTVGKPVLVTRIDYVGVEPSAQGATATVCAFRGRPRPDDVLKSYKALLRDGNVEHDLCQDGVAEITN